MNKDRFEASRNGCIEARKWLDGAGLIDRLRGEPDSWLFVALANVIRENKAEEEEVESR